MFDSGFGGLTVARALIDLLPDEDLVYFGDTGRYPYGPRPLDEVREFAHQVSRLLVERHGVKMVVVACNTASAAALDALRFDLDVPVVGVIDPGVRAGVRDGSRRGPGLVGRRDRIRGAVDTRRHRIGPALGNRRGQGVPPLRVVGRRGLVPGAGVAPARPRGGRGGGLGVGLSLTVLGCSGTYAAPGGACSGYLVGDGHTCVWVDAGPG